MADRPSVLLIGSWLYAGNRAIRGEDGKIITRKVHKKGGIKKAKKKRSGEPVREEEWVEEDLRKMKALFEKQNCDWFDTLDYREIREDGVYGEGKSEAIRVIRRFFAQEGRTKFIIYFSGHGDDNGSWSFAVTTLRPPKKEEQPSAPEPEVPTETNKTAGDSDASNGATNQCFVEVHDLDTLAIQPTDQVAPTAEPNAATPGPSNPLAKEHSTSSKAHDVSVHLERPKPTISWYDLLTYEEIIEIWDKYKKGRQRHLMMILDCCHSGRWVQKVNGEPEPQLDIKTKTDRRLKEDDSKEKVSDNTDVEQLDSRDTTKCKPKINKKRADICIQAACRPVEESMIEDDQLGSVFTNQFISAQSRTIFKKFFCSLLDHIGVLNLVSITRTPNSFRPISSEYAPFGGLKFFNSFDDMFAQTP